METAGQNRVASDDFSTLVRQLYRMFKTGSIHLMNNEAVTRQIERSVGAVHALAAEGFDDINVLFLNDTVFVNGTLLKASRDVYEAALELARLLERAGANQMSISTDARFDDLYFIVDYVSSTIREGAAPDVLPEFPAGATLRHIDPELIEDAQSGEMTAGDRVGRSYASTLVVMRYLYDNLKRGHYAASRQLKRLAQQLVLLADQDEDAFLGVTRMRHVQDDEAGRAVNSAILAILAGRQMTRNVRTLGRLALSAMLADVGRPRAAEMGADGGLAVIPRLSNAQRSRMPAATAAVMTILGRLHDESLHRTVVGYESQWLNHRQFLDELYDGALHPRLESTLVYVVRRFNDSLTFDVQAQKRMSPDQAIRHLRRTAADALELFCVDLLLQALGLVPRGTVVRMASGAVGVVVENSDKPGLYGLPTVQLYRDSQGSPLEPVLLDLAHPNAAVLKHGGIREVLADEAPPENLPQPDLANAPPPRPEPVARRAPAPVAKSTLPVNPPSSSDDLDDDIVVEFDHADAREATSGRHRTVDPDIDFDVDAALDRITGNETAVISGEHPSIDSAAEPHDPPRGTATTEDDAAEPAWAQLDHDYDPPEFDDAEDTTIEALDDAFDSAPPVAAPEADPNDESDVELLLADEDVIAIEPVGPPPPPPVALSQSGPQIAVKAGSAETLDMPSDEVFGVDGVPNGDHDDPIPLPAPGRPADISSPEDALQDMLTSFYGSASSRTEDSPPRASARAEHSLAGSGGPTHPNPDQTGPLPSIESTAEIGERVADRLLNDYFPESRVEPSPRIDSTLVEGLPNAQEILEEHFGSGDAPAATDTEPPEPRTPSRAPAADAVAAPEPSAAEDPIDDTTASMLRAYLSGSGSLPRVSSRSGSLSGPLPSVGTSSSEDKPLSTDDLLTAYLSGDHPVVRDGSPESGAPEARSSARPKMPQPRRKRNRKPSALAGGIVERTSGLSVSGEARRIGKHAKSTPAGVPAVATESNALSSSASRGDGSMDFMGNPGRAATEPPSMTPPPEENNLPTDDAAESRRLDPTRSEPIAIKPDAFEPASDSAEPARDEPVYGRAEPSSTETMLGHRGAFIGEPTPAGQRSDWMEVEAPDHQLFDRDFATSADAELTEDATPEPAFDASVTGQLIDYAQKDITLQPEPGSTAAGAEPPVARPIPNSSGSTVELSDERSLEILSAFDVGPASVHDDETNPGEQAYDEAGFDEAGFDDTEFGDTEFGDTDAVPRTRVGLPTSDNEAVSDASGEAPPISDAQRHEFDGSDTSGNDTAEVSAEHARNVLRDYMDARGDAFDLPPAETTEEPRRRLEPAQLDPALTPTPRGMQSSRPLRSRSGAETTRETAPDAADDVLSRYVSDSDDISTSGRVERSASRSGLGADGTTKEVQGADADAMLSRYLSNDDDAESTRERAGAQADAAVDRYRPAPATDAGATKEVSGTQADNLLDRYRQDD